MKCTRLKLERIKRCMSQEELSAVSGVCRTTISQIEGGKFLKIQIGVLIKIAKALNSTVQELFLEDVE